MLCLPDPLGQRSCSHNSAGSRVTSPPLPHWDSPRPGFHPQDYLVGVLAHLQGLHRQKLRQWPLILKLRQAWWSLSHLHGHSYLVLRNSTFAMHSSVILSCKTQEVRQPSFILSCLYPLHFKLAVSLLGWLIRSMLHTHTNLLISLSNGQCTTALVFSFERDFSVFVIWEFSKFLSSGSI